MPPIAAMIGRVAAEPPQLARDDLTLDLEADDEEEQRHEPVVDPEVQISVEVDQGAEPDRQLGPNNAS